MSLQVSNQATSGRRTPQVYPGFGAVPASATTTPTASNGSGTASVPNVAGSGSVGRATKGNSKQSQIPVAIGSVVVGTPNIVEITATAAAAAAPQTAVVHPGTAGTTDGTTGQKSMQSDHLYGMKQQTSATMIAATAAAGTNRSSTNGTQSTAAVDKTKLSQQKNGAGEGMAAGKKAETTAQQQLPGSGEAGSKLRAAANARNAQQKQSTNEGAATKAPDQQPKSEKTAEMENSILTEKSLRGFLSDGEEMESLLLDPWDLEDTQPLARSNAGKSKGQKAAPQAQARVSPFKTGKPQAAKQDTAMEKEQTNSPTKRGQVVEQDGEKNRSPKVAAASKGDDSATAAPSTPTSGNDSLIGRPLRSISGRRSTRPISDIKFTHHRRSTTDQLNDSISSMNVTIGSEIGNDSLLMRTPGSASRKRKDMTPESTSDIPVAESPKRARLDFSGFLGMVATPVTMLKNRLSRVKLQSTPRALVVDEEDASKVVTAEATTTTANITPQKDDEAASKPSDGQTTTTMEVDVDKKEEKTAEPGETVVAGKDGTEQQESSSATVADEDEVEVKIVTTDQQQQKQWCSIM